MSDVFSAGQQIIARLDDQLASLQDVMWASAAIGPNAENLVLPIAMVQPGQAQGQGYDDLDESEFTRESQLWQIGLRVALNPAASAATAAEVTMGQLVYQALNAIRGHTFSSISGKGRLKYISRTEMQYPPGTGVGEVWLTFEAVMITRRT